MNQAEVTKLVSQLRVKVNPKLRKFRCPGGPEERLNKLRKTVTALIKHERIELNYPRAEESRMYTERLISDAIRYGDCHKTTMEMADFWLVEKQLVHKLFKVLVPRFENYNIGYTRLIKAPRPYPGEKHFKAVLELRGNPYPSLLLDNQKNRNLIHNVLLDEARRAYRAEKYKEIAAKVDAGMKKEDFIVDKDIEIKNKSEAQMKVASIEENDESQKIDTNMENQIIDDLKKASLDDESQNIKSDNNK